ncbi:MAG: YeeE/YedE thiosulfate transporter family protein [Bacteriovoracaceae bacterium]|jgi:uncharacterized membrane protein YedE/YeeE|nr:YeeE/YedE thiosulfate transporter family protein [Bacteriovoracaceae bacterium]
MLENKIILNALIGGYLIAIAAFFLLYSNKKVLGMSTIIKETKLSNKSKWRWFFILAMLITSIAISNIFPEKFNYKIETNITSLIFSALLIGLGTNMANGCTSGHGICGLARFSKRSFIAVCTFITFGILTRTLIGLLS